MTPELAVVLLFFGIMGILGLVAILSRANGDN